MINVKENFSHVGFTIDEKCWGGYIISLFQIVPWENKFFIYKKSQLYLSAKSYARGSL